MTVVEVRKELKRKLVFGDAQQIKARDILREVQDCKEAIMACDREHEDAVKYEGVSTRTIKTCECVDKWAPEVTTERGGDWDIVNAAIKELDWREL
jgi:hypothetical protein